MGPGPGAGAALPERPPWYADGFRFDDFLQFRGAVRDCMSCLTDAGAYGAAAGAIFRGLLAQNVRYAEISFDVARALEQTLAGPRRRRRPSRPRSRRA